MGEHNIIEIVEKLPCASEYNELRQLVGWGTYRESLAEKALPQSLYGVCVFLDGQIVGMARIIGDGGLVYYICDVVVRPGYQRQGIGTQMMDKIMAYIRANASNGAIIGLMAAQGKERFYEKYGFIRRPTERLGAGMIIFWKADE